MLPKLTRFTEQELDKLLFAGMDLYYTDEFNQEKFCPFNNIKEGENLTFFISFSNDNITEDILNNKDIESFIDIYDDLEVSVPGEGDPYLYLQGFDYTELCCFLDLLLQVLDEII